MTKAPYKTLIKAAKEYIEYQSIGNGAKLNCAIERAEKDVKSQLKPQEGESDNFYQKTLKRTPIKTRLNALFQMEWLIMNTSEDEQPTAGQLSTAMDWAHELSEYVIKVFKRWEENGRPERKKSNVRETM